MNLNYFVSTFSYLTNFVCLTIYLNKTINNIALQNSIFLTMYVQVSMPTYDTYVIALVHSIQADSQGLRNKKCASIYLYTSNMQSFPITKETGSCASELFTSTLLCIVHSLDITEAANNFTLA